MTDQFEVYAITVKKLSKRAIDLTIEDYQFYIDWVHNTYPELMIREVYYEKDRQHQRLHFHGIIITPKNFYRKKVNKQDFNVCLKPVFWSAGWEKYCLKDQPKPAQKPKSQPSMFSKVKRTQSVYEPTQDDLDDFASYKSDLYSYEFPHDEFIVDLDQPVPI